MSETIFGTANPLVPYAEDGIGLTVGTKFTPSADGKVTAVRLFTSSPAPLDPIDWKLLSADGSTVLASGTWPVGQPGGTWIEATLSTPVPVVANTVYVVAAGVLKRYVASVDYFDVPTGSTHLTAPQGAGRFANTSGFAFPTTLYANSGYFVDVAYAPDSNITPPPPPPLGPIWAFGDPVTGALNVLRAATAPNGAAPTWGTLDPNTAATGAPGLPYGLVASDGEISHTAADSTATVRLTVWATTPAAARSLAGWARAVLLASRGDGVNVRHFGRGAGLLLTTDPSSKFPVCTFTVAARLLPVSI
jgi:hypothetical protein